MRPPLLGLYVACPPCLCSRLKAGVAWLLSFHDAGDLLIVSCTRQVRGFLVFDALKQYKQPIGVRVSRDGRPSKKELRCPAQHALLRARPALPRNAAAVAVAVAVYSIIMRVKPDAVQSEVRQAMLDRGFPMIR